MYVITPSARRTVLRCRFLTPVSHHDPAVNTRANERLFLRRAQEIERVYDTVPDATEVRELVAVYAVPTALAHVFSNLSAPEFLAVAALRMFISIYGGGEGVGLFSDSVRYIRLEERGKHAAIRSNNMFDFWGDLCSSLQVGHGVEHKPEQDGEAEYGMVKLLTMPTALAGLVLAQIARNSTSVLALARAWHELVRGKAGAETPLTRLSLRDQQFSHADKLVVQVPAISANTVRHEVVREPAAWHLLNALDLDLNDLPSGAAGLLYNGGDLNTSAPSSAFKHARTIRDVYPHLGLIGGSTDGFILGESNLEISAWLICRENNDALGLFGLHSDISIFDLLDQDVMTRHTNMRVDGSPMPFGFETLAKGAEVLLDFRFRPYISELEIGAFAAALATYMSADSTLGGQGARGFGFMRAEILQAPDGIERHQAAYEAYLLQNADSLRAGLLDGTLATSTVVIKG